MKVTKVGLLSGVAVLTAVASAGCGGDFVADDAAAAEDRATVVGEIRVPPLSVDSVLTNGTCDSLVVLSNWPAPVAGQAFLRYTVTDKREKVTRVYEIGVAPTDTTKIVDLFNQLSPIPSGKHRFDFLAELVDTGGSTLASAKGGNSFPCTY